MSHQIDNYSPSYKTLFTISVSVATIVFFGWVSYVQSQVSRIAPLETKVEGVDASIKRIDSNIEAIASRLNVTIPR